MKHSIHFLKGFHLIEILIVLAIVGILAAFSIPLYSQYRMQERRQEAAQILSQLAIAMEKYQVEQNTYQDATLNLLHFKELIADHRYQLIIQSATENDYFLVAKPLETQAENDPCGALTLNSRGEKGITGTEKIEDCW